MTQQCFRAALRQLRTWGTGLALAVVAACGDSTSPVGTSPVSVLLSDSAVSVRVGDDAAVSARARDASGQDLVGRRIFWSSRDTTIATVSQAGVIRGVAPGTTQISANTEGQSAVATVAVLSRPIASLTADPATTQLVVGGTQRLTARATNDQGAPVAATVTWTSLDPAVVSVTSDGLVTALTPGVGSVRATADNVTAVAVVVVTRVPAASVRVTPPAATLVVGASQQIAATAYDAAGNALAGRDVSWTSRDPAVAAVSSTGQVTAIAPGTATVDATIEGRSASAVITVRPAPVAKVTVSPASSSVGVGGTIGLTATTTDANGNPLAGRAVAWTSSAPTVARVDANGVVTGVTAGTATITAASEGVAGTAAVRVAAAAPATVASVEVAPSTLTLVQGATRTVTATPRASDGSVLAGRTVTWLSSAPSIATVSSAGVVTAVAPGTATISATADGITGTAAVTVQRAPVASVAVSPATNTLPAGTNLQLAATPRDASDNTLTGRVVTWASSNTGVLTVTSDGRVIGVAPGSATVTATSEGVSGSAAVTVTAVVRVAPAAVTVTDRGSGRTAQLVATDHMGRVLTAFEVTWSSSNASVATVDLNGLVRGVSSGAGTATAIITATYRGVTATSTVTVTR